MELVALAGNLIKYFLSTCHLELIALASNLVKQNVIFTVFSHRHFTQSIIDFTLPIMDFIQPNVARRHDGVVDVPSCELG